jgi:hypothetical protein
LARLIHQAAQSVAFVEPWSSMRSSKPGKIVWHRGELPSKRFELVVGQSLERIGPVYASRSRHRTALIGRIFKS